MAIPCDATRSLELLRRRRLLLLLLLNKRNDYELSQTTTPTDGIWVTGLRAAAPPYSVRPVVPKQASTLAAEAPVATTRTRTPDDDGCEYILNHLFS